MTHYPQALKQTYGCRCTECGELWDCYQVPCPIDVALRAMKANATCVKCESPKLHIVMPHRYEEMKQEASQAALSKLEKANG